MGGGGEGGDDAQILDLTAKVRSACLNPECLVHIERASLLLCLFLRVGLVVSVWSAGRESRSKLDKSDHADN